MKKHFIQIFVFLFIVPRLFAQEAETLHLDQMQFYAGKFSKVYVDNLANIYQFQDDRDQIKKIDANGDSVGVFSDVKRYGNIYSMDVTNPLLSIVFYRDYATIIFLDRFLNNINQIDLRQQGIMQCKAVGASYDNKVWVFDQQDSKLKKLSTDGTLEQATSDFRILFSEYVNPSTIIDNDLTVYLYDLKKGWYLLDHYGGFIRNLAYPNWKDVSVYKGHLWGRDSSFIYESDPKGIYFKKWAPDVSWSDVKYMKWLANEVVVLKDDGIHTYKITNN